MVPLLLGVLVLSFFLFAAVGAAGAFVNVLFTALVAFGVLALMAIGIIIILAPIWVPVMLITNWLSS